MKPIALIIFCTILYIFVKSFLKGYRGESDPRSASGGTPLIQDELVRDMICGVYVPRREALPLTWQGKTYYFCSEICRQKFLRNHSRP
ncbi:MAG: YHS domain-containing protein [Desulfobacteraceae bacterium]|nr:YHS domain-containing protein [Desulfobacteraceae bacterium]